MTYLPSDKMWFIDPNLTLIELHDVDHMDWVQDNFGTPELNGLALYFKMIEDGWIRIRHHKDQYAVFGANREKLKRAKDIIIPIIMQGPVSMVSIEMPNGYQMFTINDPTVYDDIYEYLKRGDK